VPARAGVGIVTAPHEYRVRGLMRDVSFPGSMRRDGTSGTANILVHERILALVVTQCETVPGVELHFDRDDPVEVIIRHVPTTHLTSGDRTP